MQDVIHAGHEAEKKAAYKPDTILGICEAVGNDLGINSNWVRVAFLPLLFFAPKVMIGAYLGLGVVVLASRLIFPKPRRGQTADQVRHEPELLAA